MEVKKEFLKMLVRMELNPALSRFIDAFFETYLILNEKENGWIILEILKEEKFLTKLFLEQGILVHPAEMASIISRTIVAIVLKAEQGT